METPQPLPPDTRRIPLRLGMALRCTDGPGGRLEGMLVALEPRWRVTHIIGGYGLVAHHRLLIPVQQISRIGSSDVVLQCSRTVLTQYEQAGPRASPEALHARTSAVLELPQQAHTRDGRTVLVAGVLSEGPDWHITHLLLRRGTVFASLALIGLEKVVGLVTGHLTLDLSATELATLPEWRDDEAIAHDVREALWRSDPIRGLGLDTVHIAVHGGVVYLSGNIASRSHRMVAHRLAQSVRGVLEVRDTMVTDDDLVAEVGRALAQDPRTHDARVELLAYLGTIQLSGTVRDSSQRDAVEEVVLSVPGVRAVIDWLAAPDDQPALPSGADLRPGLPVVCRDGLVTSIEQVVLHPATREVSYLIVRGTWPETPYRAVPVALVESVTPLQATIALSSSELAHDPRYDARRFITPEGEVVHPYRREDIEFAGWGWVRMDDLVRAALAGEPPRPEPVRPGLQGATEEYVALRRGTPVKCRGRQAGVVDHVLVDPLSRCVEHFVVRSDVLGRDVLVPVSLIAELDAEHVTLDAGLDDLERLPTYFPQRSDQDIRADLEGRLLHVHAGPGRGGVLRVALRHGVVTLHGVLPTPVERRRAVTLVETTPGVWRVHDHLRTDVDIEAAVLERLAAEPALAGAHVRVHSRAGMVTLSGTVETDAQATAALLAAREVEGVRRVIDALVRQPSRLARAA
jgi:osmotically-inducible protein OsmY